LCQIDISLRRQRRIATLPGHFGQQKLIQQLIGEGQSRQYRCRLCLARLTNGRGRRGATGLGVISIIAIVLALA
jgi:hypothetical protein